MDNWPANNIFKKRREINQWSESESRRTAKLMLTIHTAFTSEINLERQRFIRKSPMSTYCRCEHNLATQDKTSLSLSLDLSLSLSLSFCLSVPHHSQRACFYTQATENRHTYTRHIQQLHPWNVQGPKNAVNERQNFVAAATRSCRDQVDVPKNLRRTKYERQHELSHFPLRFSLDFSPRLPLPSSSLCHQSNVLIPNFFHRFQFQIGWKRKKGRQWHTPWVPTERILTLIDKAKARLSVFSPGCKPILSSQTRPHGANGRLLFLLSFVIVRLLCRKDRRERTSPQKEKASWKERKGRDEIVLTND